jgi:hypothetical protein
MAAKRRRNRRIFLPLLEGEGWGEDSSFARFALFRGYSLGLSCLPLVKRALRILAVVLLLAAIVFWTVKGAHRGWTINNIAHETTDPVTGLTGVTYEKGFVPGWDFLAVAMFAAGVLAGVSFMFGKKKSGT